MLKAKTSYSHILSLIFTFKVQYCFSLTSVVTRNDQRKCYIFISTLLWKPYFFSCQAISFPPPTTRKTLFFYLNFYIFVTSACDELIKISCAHKFLFSLWKMIKNSFLMFFFHTFVYVSRLSSGNRLWHEYMKILIISCIATHLSSNHHHKHKPSQSSLCMSHCSCLIIVELKWKNRLGNTGKEESINFAFVWYFSNVVVVIDKYAFTMLLLLQNDWLQFMLQSLKVLGWCVLIFICANKSITLNTCVCVNEWMKREDDIEGNDKILHFLLLLILTVPRQ